MATQMKTPRIVGGTGGAGARLAVERGPGWLFVGVAGQAGDDRDSLADAVWETIREHGASRVVLELDRVETVDGALGDAIAEIGTRVRDAGGLIRICGLTPRELSRLQTSCPVVEVPHFETRLEAVGTRRVEAGPCE